MPNVLGGKKYKSSKHSEPKGKTEFVEVDESDGQMVGRVMKLLGQRRALIYCNDAVQRICKIRGKIAKRVWIHAGDVVLISLREMGGATSVQEDVSQERGDILAKYEPEVYSRLKKEYNLNEKLFVQTDTAGKEMDEDLFDRNAEESESSDEEDVDVDAI